MQIEKNREIEKRRTECVFLLMYTILAVLLLLNALADRSMKEAAIWVLPELLFCWGIYLFHYQNGQIRSVLMTVAILVSFFWYGSNAQSAYVLMPVFTIVLLMIGLFQVQGLLLLWTVGTALLLAYRIVIGNEHGTWSTMGVVQFISEVVFLLLILGLEYATMRKKQLGSRQLRDAVSALKRNEHEQDEFMANVSHEIRTPLNTICGMSELILSEELPKKVREEVLDVLIAGRNLQGIVNNVLDYSELQTGKIGLTESAYNFSSVLNDVVSIAMAYNDEKKLEFIVDCDANIPYIMVGDSDKLGRAISGIVNNAIKFTEQGCVILKVRSRKEKYGVNLCITIKDTGIGMDGGTIEELFDNFNRVNTKKDFGRKGIGLGLAIAKNLVELMNGFLMVESVPGKGSEFRIVVPQKVQDDSPMATLNERENIQIAAYINQEKFGFQEIRDSYNESIENMVKSLDVPLVFCRSFLEMKKCVEKEQLTHLFLTMDEYRENPEYFRMLSYRMSVILVLERGENGAESGDFFYIYKPFSVLSVAAALNGQRLAQCVEAGHWQNQRFIIPEAKILVVDDNRMNLKVVEALLRPYQARVYTASSGKEALLLIGRMKFDIIFLDHMMPEMDGVETLHEIRKKPGEYYSRIPVVCLTANVVGGAREMLMEEGFDDYLAKPVELSGLERILKNYIPKEKRVLEAAVQQAESETTTGNAEPKVSLINREVGITNIGGNEQDYREIVKTFYEIGAEKQRELKDAYEREDWNNYAIFVHALKSTALSIGAEKLSELAKYQEVAAKVRDVNVVRRGFEGMMEHYREVLEEIQESPEFGIEPLKKEKLWEITPSALSEKLGRLHAMLHMCDAEAAKQAIDELAEYSCGGRTFGDELEAMRKEVECGAYEKAENWVEILRERVGN